MNYRTLHEGGTGLGRDETVEDTVARLYRAALAENQSWREYSLAKDEEIATLNKRCHWLLLALPVAFGLGIVFALKVLA